MYIYLASRYSRYEEMQHARDAIHAKTSHKVTSRWIEGNHRISDSDIAMGREQELIQQYLEEDLHDLTHADIVICFTERMRETKTRGGRHVEFGIAFALGKRIYVIGGAENLFYHAPAITHCDDFDHVLAVLDNIPF